MSRNNRPAGTGSTRTPLPVSPQHSEARRHRFNGQAHIPGRRYHAITLELPAPLRPGCVDRATTIFVKMKAGHDRFPIIEDELHLLPGHRVTGAAQQQFFIPLARFAYAHDIPAFRLIVRKPGIRPERLLSRESKAPDTPCPLPAVYRQSPRRLFPESLRPFPSRPP